ncbi:acyl-CoA reductase-like NAD-dependent aldehyde dehydrogenase [Rhizobium sp. 1399]|nr:acyl-CoA reductase-like NAD-dependent aldehyde dehydrogenase [Rhizobium sp. 1399]
MSNRLSGYKLRRPELFREANYIGGQWVQADSGRTYDVTNPATGEVIGTVPAMSAVETNRAIDAAYKAQKAWAALTAE